MGRSLELTEHLKVVDAIAGPTSLLIDTTSAISDADDFVLPEQLLTEANARPGYEGWDPEHCSMSSTGTVSACVAPLDTPNTLGFFSQLMEIAMPSPSNVTDATRCDVSFITELMECDFTRQSHLDHHHHQPGTESTLVEALEDHYDAIDIDGLTPSGEHPHCHHSKLPEGNVDGMDLDIHQNIFFLLQDACNLHDHQVTCDFGTRKSPDHHIDDYEGRVHANKQVPAFHVENDDTDRGTKVSISQTEESPQRPTSSSDDSDSEDAAFRFSPIAADAAKDWISASLAEGGAIKRHQSEKEQLKHCQNSTEKIQELNLNLLHLLLACSEAVSEDNFEVASVILSRLQERSCEYGTTLQRLSFYLSEALEARIMPSSKAELCQSLRTPLLPCDMLEAFCVFYNVNPIGRFCHLTLNQLILDKTSLDTAVHIVDLHIGYGMQWAAFLYAVALRPCGPPKLRLTGIGPLEEPLISTGQKLMDVAKSLQVSFEFCPLAVQLHELDMGMINANEDEVCAISSLGQLHTLLHRGSDYVDGFIAGLKSLNPKVLVLAENDVDHNSPLFLHRFVECMKYYAAVFESLDATLPSSSQARLKIERLFCGRKIGSIVACEGIERVERHETMQDWLIRLGRLGFRNAEITYAAINQAKHLLNIYYPNGYSLTEDGKTLTLRWNGIALMAIGTWH
ncbi:hypothetical protein L7F22_060756 [Adiantum nelumboides]|nr:hypothetical protein [Adiantum nelumboides]